jgi:hypothetical protein
MSNLRRPDFCLAWPSRKVWWVGPGRGYMECLRLDAAFESYREKQRRLDAAKNRPARVQEVWRGIQAAGGCVERQPPNSSKRKRCQVSQATAPQKERWWRYGSELKASV